LTVSRSRPVPIISTSRSAIERKLLHAVGDAEWANALAVCFCFRPHSLAVYTSSCKTSMVSKNRAMKRSVALAACHARALVLLERALDEGRVPSQGSREWRLRGHFEDWTRSVHSQGFSKRAERVIKSAPELKEN